MNIRMRVVHRKDEFELIGDIDIDWKDGFGFIRLTNSRHWTASEWSLLKILLERGCNGIADFTYSDK